MRKLTSSLLCGLALTAGALAVAAPASAKEWKELRSFDTLKKCQAAMNAVPGTRSCTYRTVNGYQIWTLIVWT